MKRSLQEYVELVVFGLVALLVGTGLLWLVGWVLSIGGVALKWVAGLLWNLLRFIVPVAIAGGLVYFLVKAAQDRQPKPANAGAGSTVPVPAEGAGTQASTAQSAGEPVTSTTSHASTPPAGSVESAVAEAEDIATDAMDEAEPASAADEDDEERA